MIRRCFAAAVFLDTPPWLQGKRDEPVVAAVVAAKPREPAGEPPATEDVSKLVLDEPRQALPLAESRGLGTKALEVITDHLL